MTRTLRSLAAALLVSFALPACDAPDASDEVQDVTAGSARFETFKGADGKYYFQLLAKNGERVLDSQAYATLSSAKKGITSVKTNGKTSASYAVLTAENGEFYFNLIAGNGENIGTSEMYSSKSAAQKGVDATIVAVTSAETAAAVTGDTRFETFKGVDGKYYFHLRAKNGEIILASQGYSSKSSATTGVESVKKNGIEATRYDVFEGANGQFSFRLTASNGKTVGHGEMYATKDAALRGADGVRDLLRDLSGKPTLTDDQIKADFETAATDLLFMSESDYPFTFVTASPGAGAPITESLVKSSFASYVDADPAADKPMASLKGMSQTWADWKGQGHMCYDDTDPYLVDACHKMRNLEQVIESNLTDIHVFYFGAHGSEGNVDGIGVSILIVGRTPSGTLAGVRTIAIWT